MPPNPLKRLRRLCLALPEAHEVEAWGEPTFRVRNKLFAMYAASHTHHGAGRPAVWCKAGPGNQAFMVQTAPERFFVPPYVGPSGWIGVYLDRVADWSELAELLEDSYRLTAPKRLLRGLEEAAPRPTPPRPAAGAVRRPRSRRTTRGGAFGGVLAFLLVAHGPALPPRVHEVRLTSNRFEPAETSAHAGDTLRFVNGAGGPHNIQFFADSLSDSARRVLTRAMPGDKLGPLSSPLLLDRAEVYEFEIPALPPGRYPFVCLPHFAGNMKGALLITP